MRAVALDEGDRTALEAVTTKLRQAGRVGQKDLVTHTVTVNRVVAADGQERLVVEPLGPVDRQTMRGMVDEASRELRRRR